MIIVKTSDGNILRVDWDVGKPDQTIKTMFVVSIRKPLDLFSKKANGWLLEWIFLDGSFN